MNLVPRNVLCVLKKYLGLRAYKRYSRHLLNTHKSLRLERSKKFLRVYGKNLFKKIMFTDEKIFTTEQKFSKQIDKVYAQIVYKAEAKVPGIRRGHHQSSVMVLWGVSWNGATAIHFCTPGVKVTIKICEETIPQACREAN